MCLAVVSVVAGIALGCGDAATTTVATSAGGSAGSAQGGSGQGGMGGAYVPECGNFVVDPGEDCDDGNTLGQDACKPDCTLPACGDGIIDYGETCFSTERWDEYGVQHGFGNWQFRDMAVGDCDGDGDQDIITLGYSDELPQTLKVRARRNQGDGTLPSNADSSEYTQGAINAHKLLVGDFDTTVGLDVAVLTSSALVLLSGNSACGWSYVKQVQLPSYGLDATVADLDQDSRLDIVIAVDGNPNDELTYFLSTTQMLSPSTNSRSSQITDIISADFDGDGNRDDIAYTDMAEDAVYTRIWSGSAFKSAEKKPKGSERTGIGPISLTPAAYGFQEAPIPDIVTANYIDHNISALQNSKSEGEEFRREHPHISVEGELPHKGRRPRSLAAADVDGDNDEDILVTNDGDGSSVSPPTLSLLFLVAPGRFVMADKTIFPWVEESFPLKLDQPAFAPHLVDMDGNGTFDIVAARGKAIIVNLSEP